MKYCQKCGKELYDEAVVCPGCGCPVETRIVSKNHNAIEVVNSVLTLNIVAIIISFLSGFMYSGIQVRSWPSAVDRFLSDPLVYRLFGLVCISFAVSVLLKIVSQKNALRKMMTWLYYLTVLATVTYFVLYSLVYFFLSIGGVGLFMGVAPILQIIAAKKLLKANK